MLSKIRKKRWLRIGLIAFLILILGCLYYRYLPKGDDWETFYWAAKRLLNDKGLYGEKITFAFYSNPPWVAAILSPLTIFSERLSQVIITLLSLSAVGAVCKKLGVSYFQTALVILSPPMIYVLIHGQIDALILAGFLLPSEFWLLVGISKPQTAVGLIFGIEKEKWLKTGLITGLFIFASFCLWGNWARKVINQPRPFVNMGHNLWFGLWPFQVPVGVALILLGVEKDDHRLLLASSPFFSPYAPLSCLLGPWITTTAAIKNWQGAVVLISWWGAVAYRAFLASSPGFIS